MTEKSNSPVEYRDDLAIDNCFAALTSISGNVNENREHRASRLIGSPRLVLVEAEVTSEPIAVQPTPRIASACFPAFYRGPQIARRIRKPLRNWADDNSEPLPQEIGQANIFYHRSLTSPAHLPLP